MALPNTKVEIAFDSGYTTPAASRTWTDVSAWVESQYGLTINRGRADEISQIQPSILSLTLDNTDGRFTPEKTGGAYYPNVKKGRPIRVTSTYNAVQYVRFVGYINEWPVVWPDSTSATSTVTITASSRMARLGVSAELKSIVEEEILVDSPEAYYTLGEPAEATSAADSSGKAAPALTMAGAGTDVTFGTATGPGTDGLTAATFAGAKYLAATLNTALTDFSLKLYFSTATTGETMVSYSGGLLAIATTSGTGITAAVQGTLLTTGDAVADSLVHCVEVTRSGTALSLYLDGVSKDTDVNGTAIAAGDLWVGSGSLGAAVGLTNPFHGSLSHVALSSTADSSTRAAAYATAGSTGFAGESGAARITRLAGYAGVPAAELSLDTGVATIAHFDITGTAPTAAMQKVTDTENGILYDAKDGTLTFKDRDHRYALASSFTLNATAQEVQGDLLPRLDDQFLVNDATATGIDTSARIIDATSTADYGYYRQTIDAASSDPEAVRALAEWRVGLNKQPTSRYPTVSVDVVNLSTAQAALILAADISTRFGLSSLPTQAPASTADFFVEGYAERITESKHLITFNTSPTTGYAGAAGVWQLDVNNIDGPYILAL